MNRRSRVHGPRNNHRTQLELLEPRDLFAAHIVGNSTTYATIQAAVNAALAGQTINVDAGTYDETVVVTKSLTIRGAQAGVDARNTRGAESIVYATQTVFDVNANDVTIDGFTIEGNCADIGALQGAGVLMRPSIHGTHVLNNVIQNNVTGVYLSNNSNTDVCLIQHNLIQNNFEANNNWQSKQENGSRGIYSDGTVSGGYLTNVLIDGNTIANFNFKGGDEDEGIIALQALTAGKQFNITISNNYLALASKALLATNVTNLTFIGNTATQFNDGSSGPVRFEGNANTVNVQYNSIYGNSGPGVAADSSGVSGDSSGFVVNYNNIYQNDGIGVLTIANAYDGLLTAVGNWWGNASGPSGDGPGTGQALWANGVSGHGVNPKGAAGGMVTFSPWSTSMIDITAIPVPAAPAGLSATILSTSSIGLAWTPQMSTATSQLLQRSTDGVNFTTIATLPPLLNAFTDSGITSSAVYTYRVIAANNTGNSMASNNAALAFSSPLSVPFAPTNLTAAAISSSQIKLSWVAVGTSQTSYTLLRSTDNVNFTTVATGIATSATSYTDSSGLAGGTLYYYELSAVNSVGSSPVSNSASATTISASATVIPLSGLSWVSATAGFGTVQKNASIKGNTLTLKGVTYATGLGTHAASTITYNLAGAYNFFQSDVGIDDEEMGIGSGSVDFQVIGDGKVLFDSGILTSASPTVSISVSVAGVQSLSLVATNGVAGSIDYDHSDWAGAVLIANPSAPAAPANLTASSIGNGSVKLSWSAVGSNQTGYKIDRSLDGTNWTPLATTTASSYTDTGLTSGTKYYYRIRATNSAGDSPNSNVASVTPAATVNTYLSDLQWTSATAGYGTVQKDKSIKGTTLTLKGVTYAKGIGTHAASTITYNLAGQYTTFLSDVGIDDEEIGIGSGSVDFQVIGDGKVLFDNGVLTSASPTVSIAVSVAGVKTLQLVATNGVAGSIDYDHADWAGATLIGNAVVPAAPASLAAVAMGSSSIKLTWAAPTSAVSSYVVDRSSDGVTFTTIASNVAGSATSWTDNSILSANTTYYYRLRAVNSVGTSANSNTASAATLPLSTVTYASDLPWTSATAGWGTVQRDQSIKGNPLTVNGVVYAKGLGTHASSSITFHLGGSYSTFLSDIGIDDEELGIGVGSVDFQVIADGKVIFDSGIITSGSPTTSINVSVAGVQNLTLVANNGVAGSIDYDHADWAGAQLLA